MELEEINTYTYSKCGRMALRWKIMRFLRQKTVGKCRPYLGQEIAASVVNTNSSPARIAFRLLYEPLTTVVNNRCPWLTTDCNRADMRGQPDSLADSASRDWIK